MSSFLHCKSRKMSEGGTLQREEGTNKTADCALKKIFGIAAGGAVFAGLYACSRNNYLLFHCLAELFSVAVALSVFLLVLNSRRFVDNDSLVFLGFAYLSVGFLDLLHTLAYKGMGVFPGPNSADTATQLWIAARALESFSLLIFPFFSRRRHVSLLLIFTSYSAVVVLLLLAIFHWEIFPACYIEGVGLTSFKKGAEYTICLILLGAMGLLHRRRCFLLPAVAKLMLAAMAVTIAAELFFTFYVSVFGLANFIGHFLKIISFFLVYMALIHSGLTKPYAAIFHELEQERKMLSRSEELLRNTLDAVSDGVWDYRVRTGEIFLNPRSAVLFGLEPGKGATSMAALLLCIHPDDHDSMQQALQEHVDGKTSSYRCEFRIRTKNGGISWILGRGRACERDADGKALRIIGTNIDISEGKRAEGELRESRAQLSRLYGSVQAGIVQQAADGRIVHANRIAVEILGQGSPSIEGLNSYNPAWRMIDESGSFVPPEQHPSMITLRTGEPVRNAVRGLFATHPGIARWLLINTEPLTDAHGGIAEVLITFSDITEQKRHQNLLAARLRLSQFSVSHSVEELLRAVLDEAELLTGSEIGFFHFLEHDQTTLRLQAWSTNTIKNMCNAEGAGLHYPVSEAGVWIDCVRERRPVIHNDYSSLPHRRGLPTGHVPVIRELVVPVFRGDNIVAVLGVGNRISDYSMQDVETVEKIADMAWDIVERKQAQDMLVRSKEEWEKTFDAINDVIILQDTSMRVVKINRRGCDILERNFGDIIGKRCHELFCDSPLACVGCPILKTRENLKPQSREIKNDKLGKIFLVSASPILDAQGKLTHMVHVVRDVTERRYLETKLAQAQKMEAIGTLAGGIAHDFNNILTPMIGFSELIKMEIPADSPLQQDVDNILAGAIRARDLVRQILSFSRRAEEERIAMQIQTILKEVLKLSRASLPSNIRIVADISNNCPSVFADPTQIHQLAMNLITNAFHAMEATGGELTVSLQAVDIVQEGEAGLRLASGGYAMLTVEDTGCGIDGSIINSIFEPYFTTKEKGKGTGLGLSVVLSVVRKCGGDIQVESSPGHGTTFRVYLPLFAQIEANGDSGNTISALGKGERILLVDDEKQVAAVTARMLEKLGYRVRMCTDPVAAIELFRADPSGFDLVISDVTMPVITGETLTAMVKQARADMPVILCTGYSSIMNEEKASRLGVDGFLYKPARTKDIAEMIRRILDGT